MTSSAESLGDVHIHRGIFQGDSLSPLLFVLCMIPLTLTLRKVAASYERGNKEFRINHLLFMDDLKLFGKNQDQIDSLVQTVHLFSEDIGMQFGLNKCGVLVLKRGKAVKAKWYCTSEWANDERNRRKWIQIPGYCRNGQDQRNRHEGQVFQRIQEKVKVGFEIEIEW